MKIVQGAVLWPKSNRFSIEQLRLEPPQAGEVLIKMVASGICHTDMVLRDAGIAPRPIVLGHEGSGIVEQVGASVEGFAAGDRVAISFASCGGCRACEKQAPGYCEQFFALNFLGARGDGSCSLSKNGEAIHSHVFGQSSFSTYAVCNVGNLVKIDESVPLELAGPFGCGFQTGAGAVLNSLKVTADSSVMVLGAGAVGMAAIMAASLIVGATQVIAVDLRPARLELAKSVGASAAVVGSDEDFIDQIATLCPQGVDYIIDTTGYLPLLESCLPLLAPQGVLGLVASYALGTTLGVDVLHLLTGGRRIQGIMAGDSDIHTFILQLLEHYKQGRFPVDKLVKYYDFIDINSAIDDSESGKTLKAIVRMADSYGVTHNNQKTVKQQETPP